MDHYELATRGDSEGLWDWDLASKRVHFSPRWAAIVGCQDHEVSSTPEEWLERVHPEDISQVRAELDAHLAEGPCGFEFRHRLLHKDGTYHWMSCRGVVVRNEAGQAVRLMGAHSDVTAETVADALTGLPNLLLFMDHLTRSVARAKRHQSFHFAVLLLDLDRPEARGKQPGPTAADPLLTAAARRLETFLRGGDTPAGLSRERLVARLRGDEFAILLDGLKEVGDATIVADHVLRQILEPFTVGGREVFLSASIGIALSATGYTQAEDVLRDADTALYRAKLLGKARAEVFDTAIVTSAQTERQLEADFKEALERRQFVLFYQPIVSLASNRIAGFEALVRWQHPVLGMVPPVEFIPLAEKTGLIVPLGDWILREACLQLKAWQESLPDAKDVWVSVNLSSAQFGQPALVEHIGEALRDVGLDAHCLMLELTEGVALENPTAVKGLLMQLRIMGARVGLDDFGTGQSSLAYLHQFPADILKLDRAFVRDMETRTDARDIVAAVIGLSHTLGLQVIAEGVENEEQLALVRALKCEYVQGFLFSRPVDNETAARLLREGLPSRAEPERQSVVVPEEPQDSLVDDAQVRTAPSRRPRLLYVAAAAVATLACAGVVALFTYAPPPAPALPAPPPPPVRAIALEPPPLPAVEPPAPQPAPERAGRRSPAAPAVSPATVTPGTAVIHERAETETPASMPASSAVEPETYSLAVVHRHALGGCRGALTITRAGVAFVPEKAQDKPTDGFAFKYDDFLYELSADNLTVKSHARTYRFKSAEATGKQDNRSRLQQAVANITRLRPSAPGR